ncbi:MAG: glycosyl hydrolase, partial [Spirochaetales bacterium]|nr:glycosyl hydrolase [Spirochaetales bacterium]
MKTIITTNHEPGSLALFVDGAALPIVIDPDDCRGVGRAALALGEDFAKVCGTVATVVQEIPIGPRIIAGTVGHSRYIDELVESGAIDGVFLRSNDESFIITVVDEGPSLVVAGGDRRGTIFGLYEISRQIGINPWHFWLNVPPKVATSLYALRSVTLAEYPAVRYRGIFLNDEAPSLTNWILNTYGTVKPSEDPPIPEGIAAYGSDFYTKLFDLLLRLKANYLLPAMWNNAFSEDDAQNALLADQWGIIMGTSHQEPMTRAQQEWDRRYRSTLGHWNYSRHKEELLAFWREGLERNRERDTVITIGLRGADDTPMGEQSWRTLEEIVEQQRAIIADVMDRPADQVPQLWCLYKEVQSYYEEGMRVPDDVILLWSDDNWGNLRRVPTQTERQRPGGAGIYYHFDYHGDPRNYQWINTTQIAKIWDQMSLARRYGADRLWVVNVGHFKGQEYPISFFLDLAWQPEQFRAESLQPWSVAWCASIFGDELAPKISSLIERIVELNSRRKPELLYPLALSLINYREAELFVEAWETLRDEAEELVAAIAPSLSDAYLHLVLFPARSSAILADLHLAVGRNHLWASQGRLAANEQARLVEELFDAFNKQIEHYHRECGGGMWRGFMDQPVLGYIDWNDPPKNTLEHIHTAFVRDARYHRLGVAVEGSSGHWPSLTACSLPSFDNINDQRRRVELFNRSSVPYAYRIECSDRWIQVEGPLKGMVEDQQELWVSIDWNEAPIGSSKGWVKVLTDERYKEVTIALELLQVDRSEIKGYAEIDRTLVIDAIEYQELWEDEDNQWQDVALYGPFGA